MIDFIDEKDCCGCSACSAICPKQCITMEQGSIGHLFPKIDQKACVSCGACDLVCPMNKELKVRKYNQKVYAAYSKDKDIRFRGSSGGMFETFATALLEEGFVIYGAAFDENLKLKCTKAETKEELLPLLKSKYLQSDISEKFSEIKEGLEKGEKIFITATPCQIFALKNFLKKSYENLITADFFCHGVPSQKFFDQCLSNDEETYGGKVIKYFFRSKKKGGSTPHYFTAYIDKNKKVKRKFGYYFKSTFYAFFQKYICLRESCYDCKFAGKDRASDITIADFHEIDKYISGINRFDGVSTVVVNSVVGEKLFELCKENLFFKELDLNKLIKDGTCFYPGTKKPKNREEFVKDYNKLSVKELSEKYVNPKSYIVNQLYYSSPAFLRKAAKRFIGE